MSEEKLGVLIERLDNVIARIDKIEGTVEKLETAMNKGWGVVVGGVAVLGFFASEVANLVKRVFTSVWS